MMIRFYLIFVFILFFISNDYSHAEDVTARADIDTNNLLIGEPIRLKLSVKAGLKENLIWPEIPDTINSIDIYERSKIDTLDSAGSRYLFQTLTLTSFESGSFELQPFIFSYKDNKLDSIVSVATNPVLLNYSTVAVDTTKPIKDIKDPLGAPVTLDEYIWYIVGGVLIIAAVIAAYIFWKKRKPKIFTDLDYDPKIPPHVLALEGLRKLEEEKLWQKGMVKIYHIKLTEIIRLYIFRRFDIQALEMTTDETIYSLRKSAVKAELIEKMEKMLRTADLVKFAKVQPLPDENTFGMNTAIEFVNATTVVISPKITGETEKLEGKADV